MYGTITIHFERNSEKTTDYCPGTGTFTAMKWYYINSVSAPYTIDDKNFSMNKVKAKYSSKINWEDLLY